MKDLKFRSWHHGGGDPRVKGGMQYSKHCGLRVFFGNVESEDLAVEVMQYTGLHDKNGVEICEGDIISDHVGIGVVKYSKEKAAFRVSYGDGRAKWFIDYTLLGEKESIEVIGNIHENPELLGD